MIYLKKSKALLRKYHKKYSWNTIQKMQRMKTKNLKVDKIKTKIFNRSLTILYIMEKTAHS